MKELFNYLYEAIRAKALEESNLCKIYSLKIERIKADYNEADFMELVADNIEWLVNTGILTGSALRSFAPDIAFSKYGIYFEGEVISKDKRVILFESASAVVSGHSRLLMFDNATAEAYDSSFVSCFGASSVKAKNCKIIAFGNSSVESLGLCLIEKYDETVSVKSTSKDLIY